MMKRKLITLTEEQQAKLSKMSNGNDSGFLQSIIEKLYEAYERNKKHDAA